MNVNDGNEDDEDILILKKQQLLLISFHWMNEWMNDKNKKILIKENNNFIVLLEICINYITSKILMQLFQYQIYILWLLESL